MTDPQPMTYNVEFVSELPGVREADDTVTLWAVRSDGSKLKIRNILISYLEDMRRVNRVPKHVADTTFLGQGLGKAFVELGFHHLEMSVSKITKKSDNEGQTVSFPASALDQDGATPAL